MVTQVGFGYENLFCNDQANTQSIKQEFKMIDSKHDSFPRNAENSFVGECGYGADATYTIKRIDPKGNIFKVQNSSRLRIHRVVHALAESKYCLIFLGRKMDDIIFTVVPYSPVTLFLDKIDPEDVKEEDLQKFLKQKQNVIPQSDEMHLQAVMPSPLLTDFDDPLYTQRRHAIDLGCGSGAATSLLLNRGYQVVAVDMMKKAVDNLNPIKIFSKLTIVHGNIITYPLKKHDFSLVVCSLVLPHIDPKHWMHIAEKIYNSLLPGGNFICDFSLGGDCAYKIPNPFFAVKLLESCGFRITQMSKDGQIVSILAAKAIQDIE